MIIDEKKIIGKIQDLAKQISENGQPITRADLAYELKNEGFERDSFLITEWVWRAFLFYGSSEQIRVAFVNNERKNYLVDEYQIYPVLESGNFKKLSGLLTSILEESKESLGVLDESLATALEEKLLNRSRDLAARITGTKGVSDIQSTASFILKNYTNLVNAYDDAKGDVKAVIATFIALRDYIDEIYRKYALALTDIFGESIKSISPDLFDFDSIQWLDVQKMLENIQMEYNQLMNRCGELMTSISNDFSASLKSASANYRLADNKKVGLFLAGVAMINHYLDVNQQTNELQSQLLTLKNSVKHDATHIKGDMARLLLIYKGMNDYHIPRIEAFYRYSRQIMENDFNAILTTLYANPQVSVLKQKRDSLLEEWSSLSREMSDSQMNINYYNDHIAECTALIESMEEQYYEAKNCKPKKPFLLLNLLTLGSMNTKYNREISSWYKSFQPIIKQYEALKVDMSLDKEDLIVHQKIYANGAKRRELLKKELQQSTKAMQKALQIDNVTKKKLVHHLEDLIKLLKVAKDILNTKLDDKLVKTASAPDYKNEKLPSEITQHIRTLSQSLTNSITTDQNTAKQSLDRLSKPINGVSDNKDYNEEELNVVAEAQQQVVQKALSVFEAWADLQQRKVEGKLIDAKYDRELRMLQEQFHKEMLAIDDKSSVLYQVTQLMKTTEDEAVLRQALLSLANIEDGLSEDEWNDFFNGNKTIVI